MGVPNSHWALWVLAPVHLCGVEVLFLYCHSVMVVFLLRAG